MHSTTLDYLKPTEQQIAAMEDAREACKTYMNYLETNVPDGPDKTYLMRRLREVNMWVMIAISRQPDGAPRI